MLTSRFLTATLASFTVVGSAGLVYAQSSTSPGPGTMNRDTAAPAIVTPDPVPLNQAPTAPGTVNRGTDTMTPPVDTPMNPDRSTLGQDSTADSADRPMNDRLVARADRN